MSQQKVDHNKELKHNRKDLVKKRKRNKVISIVCSCLVGVVFLGWVGYSITQTFSLGGSDSTTYVYYDINSTAMDDYLSDLAEQYN